MPSSVRAWRPDVPGIAEVFHARIVDHAYPSLDHAYPSHTHSTWTLLVVNEGAVRYDLHRCEHGAVRSGVTLLPPGVAHDGRAATPGGFRKRVLYLHATALPARLVGKAVDRPAVTDEVLHRSVDRLHHALDHRGDELAARSGLLLVTDRLIAHLDREEPSRTRSGTHGRPTASATCSTATSSPDCHSTTRRPDCTSTPPTS